jgi:hypothetical protein
MDLDSLKCTIQNFFQEDTVTIVGSGLSSAEGIPNMSKLAIELQKKIPSQISFKEDQNIWDAIDADLASGAALEKALQKTKPSEHIEDCIRKVTAQYIGQAESKVLHKLVRKEQTLRFEEYIGHFNIHNNGLTVITTNYDRLIEYACEHQGVRVDTLFVGKYIAHFSPEQSKFAFVSNITKRAGKKVAVFAPKITVLKPHGCLSWHMIGGEPYSIPSYPLDDCLIITPGINKYKEGYSVPFDTHRSKANISIDDAQRYIIIGYGFSDDHLETHLVQQLSNGKPALILTYSLSKKAQSLVSSCKHIIAICCEDANSSRVITATENQVFPDINLWDLHEMIKEVF